MENETVNEGPDVSIYLLNLAITFGTITALVLVFLVLMFILRVFSVSSDWFNSVIDFIINSWNNTIDIFKRIGIYIKDLSISLYENVRDFFIRLINIGKDIVDETVDAVVSAGQAVKNVYDITESIVIGVIDTIKNTFNNIINAIENTWNTFRNAVSSVATTIINAVVNAGETYFSTLSSFFEFVLSIPANIIQGIKDFFDFIIDLPSNLIDGIVSAISGLVDSIKDALTPSFL